MQLGNGEYSPRVSLTNAWKAVPPIAHARSLLCDEIEMLSADIQPAALNKLVWPIDLWNALRQWRVSLPERIREIPRSQLAKEETLKIVHAWAAERCLAFDWFVHWALVSGWAGPRTMGLQEELEGIWREENVLAFAAVPHTRSLHCLPSGPFHMHWDGLDLSRCTRNEVRQALQAAFDRSVEEYEHAYSLRAKVQGWKRTKRVVEGGTRNIRTRYRWWVRRRCFQQSFKTIADSKHTDDDVRGGFWDACKDIGLSSADLVHDEVADTP